MLVWLPYGLSGAANHWAAGQVVIWQSIQSVVYCHP